MSRSDFAILASLPFVFSALIIGTSLSTLTDLSHGGFQVACDEPDCQIRSGVAIEVACDLPSCDCHGDEEIELACDSLGCEIHSEVETEVV